MLECKRGFVKCKNSCLTSEQYMSNSSIFDSLLAPFSLALKTTVCTENFRAFFFLTRVYRHATRQQPEKQCELLPKKKKKKVGLVHGPLLVLVSASPTSSPLLCDVSAR